MRGDGHGAKVNDLRLRPALTGHPGQFLRIGLAVGELNLGITTQKNSAIAV